MTSLSVGPVRTSLGRPRHVPELGPGRLVPSPTSGRQFRPSLGPDAQAHIMITLGPQSWSVGPDVPCRPDLGHGRPFAGSCIFCRTPGRNRCNVQIGNGCRLVDGLYRASRRKVHGFFQPDRPATEQVALGSRPGERIGVHHTASVLGVTEEEHTIRVEVLTGIRVMLVGCVKGTCGTHVKYSILYDSTGEMLQRIHRWTRSWWPVRQSSGIKAFTCYWPLAGDGGQGRHAGNTQAGPWWARGACASLPSIESKRIRRRAAAGGAGRLCVTPGLHAIGVHCSSGQGQ